MMAQLFLVRRQRAHGKAMLLVTSPQIIMSITKIENKIVAVAAREWFAVHFESTIERETQDALIGPSRRENVLVLRESK
jgi:hypothetical protein